MNLRWLRSGDWLAAAGGAVLLIALFLPWYTVAPGQGTVSSRQLTGWQAFSVIDILLALAALVGLALAATTAVRRTPALPVALGVLGTPIGTLAAILVLVRIVDQPGPNEILDVAAGAWLAFAGALLLVAGSWISIADERNRGVAEVAAEVRPTPPAA
jgi:hypothetical protein